MLFEADKVMFEIYRETGYSGEFRVVYFTELQDHNKETEINRAMSGEHLYDGFIKNYGKEEAKEKPTRALHRCGLREGGRGTGKAASACGLGPRRQAVGPAGFEPATKGL